MTSPFQDIYDTTPAVQQTPDGGSPFDDIYGGQPKAVDAAAPTPQQADVGIIGSAQRAAQQAADRAAQLAKVDEALKQPNLSLVEHERLSKMREDLNDPEWYNKVTDKDRSIVSNVVRGALHGVVDYGILGAADLGLAAAQIALPKGVENAVGLGTGRERIADLQTSFKEFVDPQGKAAAAATVVGGLVGGIKPFGLLNSTGFRALARVSPAAARIVEIGLKPGATYLERFAAHAIGSGTVDAVQAVDIMSSDMSTKEKLKQLAITVGISGASAAFTARKVNKGEAPLIAETAAKPHEGDAEAVNPDRAKEAEAALAKAQEAEARQEEQKRLKLEARVLWQKANPTKKWETLPKAERIKVIADYIKGESDAKAQAPIAPESPPEEAAAPVAPEAAAPVAEPEVVPPKAAPVDEAPAPGVPPVVPATPAAPAPEAPLPSEPVAQPAPEAPAVQAEAPAAPVEQPASPVVQPPSPTEADAIVRGEVPKPAVEPPLETPKGAEPPIEPPTVAETAKPPKEPKAPKVGKPKGRTLEDVDKDIDKIDEDLDAKRISDAVATTRLEKLKREKMAIKKLAASQPAPEGAPPAAPVAKVKLPDSIGRNLKEFSADELANIKRGIRSLIQLPEAAPHKQELIDEFSRISDYEAARDNPAPGSGGVVLNMSPATVGGAVGFFAGFTQGDDEQERFQNAIYYMAVGAALGYGANRYIKKATAKAVPEYQQEIRKMVKSIEDGPIEDRVGYFTQFRRNLRRNYAGIVRRSIGIEDANRAIGLGKAQFFQNAGKMAELFGLFRHMADSWITDKPRYWDDDSNLIDLQSEGLRTIALHAKGDTRTVGDLMAAKRTLELAGGMKPRKTGIDLVSATRMISNAPEMYHQAVAMARQYATALARVGQMAGLLSDETVAKWDLEYYAPIMRLFGGMPGGSSGSLDTKARGPDSIAANQPFKRQKGGTLPFQNPFEALVDLTPRLLRAAEFNRLAVKFFSGLAGADPEVRKLIGRRLEKPGQAAAQSFDAMTDRLLRLSEESGGKMTRDEALRIVHTMSDQTLNVTDDVIHFYVDGKRQSWRVNAAVARGFRSLQGHELSAMMEGLGFADQVANVTRVGVTINPWFILKQAFRDNWQYYMNGAYGTIPVYANLKAFFYQAKGYSHLIRNTDDVKMYRGFGGGGDNIASEGLQIIGGKVALLDKIKTPPVNNQLELAAKQLAHMSIFEAYTTLMAPLADAGRIGAYLHERGRGSSVAESVYRAKKTGANYNNKGDFAKIQALSRMTLFLNATLQSFDAAKDAFKTDPVGYITRGLVGIALPSVYLWYANKDDQEIQEVRGTAAGKRAWPVRIGGKIVMIPKSQFDGHVFGTSVEAWLDQKYKDDPDAIHDMGAALMQDAAVNLLPVVGVVPVSLANNLDLNTGQPIVGDQLSNLDIEYQIKDRTSTAARIASRSLAPLARSMNVPAVSTAVSPVGIDYIVRNLTGTTGSDIVSAVSFILDQQNGAGIPPLEELPFVSSAFARQPSLNAGSIKEFYNHATVAAQKANTLQHLAQTDPDSVDTYVQANENEIGLAEMYGQVRSELADMRKALIDIDQAPPDVMSSQEKRDLTDEITQQMIEVAKTANSVAREMHKERSPTR